METNINIGQIRIIILSFLFLLIFLEIIWSWKKDLKNYNLKESFANVFILFGFQFSRYLMAGYQLAFLYLFYEISLLKLPISLPVFLFTFIVVDFLYYWFHRISHTHKFFWAFHLVHHSSLWMNLTTAYRLNWMSALVTPLFFLPAVLIGFPPELIAASVALNLLYQFFMHTELVGKIPLIEGIIDTPSAHRVHHGSNEIYLDKNFGGFFMIWDRIFGTYQSETEKVKYGITTGFVSHNPFVLIFHGFVDYFKDKMNYKG